MGQTRQRRQNAEHAGEGWTNGVLIASLFESECEALCISASPGQPDPWTCQSWWCLDLRAHADGPHPWANLRLVGLSIKGKADGENEQQTVSQMTVMIQICWPRPSVPRWYDFFKRLMIQTKKSTPLPHNSLSLHLFLSSSCCCQDCAIYTLTHTINQSHNRLSVIKCEFRPCYFLIKCTVLYEFSMYCRKYTTQYLYCCVMNMLK